MMKSEEIAKQKQSTGSRLRDNVSKIYDCFLTVSRSSKVKKSEIIPDYKYPSNFNDVEVLQQSYLFCFPFAYNPDTLALFKDHANHFTFILTDIEGKHRFGFCKLTNDGKKCYCILSFLPWFEIFYKILNYTHELSLKSDEETIETMLMELQQQVVPVANARVQISPTLAFSIPDTSSLPSIPENRNLSEYYAAANSVFMMEIFASLMFERRIIFTSKSLSVLTSSIHSAEALLNPLHWQHIFIPVMPLHLLEYCLAPMPYLVGVHSSLMPKVREMISIDDDVIVANIDAEEIETAHNDSARIPNDTMSFLKSLLRKSNAAMGKNLSLAFLRAQARLIGGYRYGLKFGPGEPIVFDEDKFIDAYKSTTGREFARSLVQLQTFKQFVDGRLDMLNGGIGFRDDFENEVNVVDAAGNREGDTYKEWLAAARKGGNKLITQFQRKAKDNMKVAQQSLKNYIKQQQAKQESSLNRQKSLDQSTQRVRPSRPPLPDPEKLAEHRARQHPPSRPPLPANPPKQPLRRKSVKRTRHYTELDLDNMEQASTSESISTIQVSGASKERSMSGITYQELDLELLSDMEQVMDEKITKLTSPDTEVQDKSDLLLEVPGRATNASDEESSPQKQPLRSIEKSRNSSEIRRRNRVVSRPSSLKAREQSLDESSADENEKVNQTTDQLIDLSTASVSQDTVASQSLTSQSSAATNDLLGLDFSPFAVEPTKVEQANGEPENWSKYENTNFSNPYNPFTARASRPSSEDTMSSTHSPALSPFISSSPFLSGQASSGSSRTSSPSKTPHKLSPEKMNPFKVNQSGTQPNYNLSFQQSTSSHVINTNKQSPVHNLQKAALFRSSSNQSLPVHNRFLANQNSATSTKATELTRGSSLRQQTNKDNELFSDLLGSWKTRDGF